MTWFARLLFTSLCFAVFSSPSVRAQAVETAPLHFEVATIRPARPDDRNSNLSINQGHMTVENLALLAFLKEAYGLNLGSDDQIVGAPGWVRTTAYDIKATEDDATAKRLASISPENQRRAVDGILRDRIQERLEDRTRTVALFVQAKSGSKLTERGYVNLALDDRARGLL